MNIKRTMVYCIYYGVLAIVFFMLELALLAHLEKDWQFALVTIIIFFGIILPSMNYIESKIDKYLPRK